MSGVRIGIDLGTTNSVAAVLQAGAAVVVPNAMGRALTPSVVSVDDDGTMLVGEAAVARQATHPRRTAALFKRAMGTDQSFRLAGREFRAEQLSALVLESIKRDVEASLGQPVEEAVVTVPAYFGELQRRATRHAAEIAGLHVERIINEPTAAALAYGLQHRDADLQAVVLDVGGGTFDVSVLEISDGVVEIQGSAGDTRLGGEDFVDALQIKLLRRIREQLGVDASSSEEALARIHTACERLKLALSGRESAQLVIPGLRADGKSVDVDLTVSRAEATEWWAETLRRFRFPIRRALGDAGVSPDRVDAVLLVGGATRMPAIVELAATTFGQMPIRDLPPDEAVAMGAAVQMGLKAGDEAVEDMVATDVAPFSLGTAVRSSISTMTVDGVFEPIIERGTVLPASRVSRVFTVIANQRTMEIEVYQGEAAMVRDNQKLGSYGIKGIPKGKAGEQAVDVRFTYDLNGLLEVETTVVGTGKVHHLVLDRSGGQMSEAAVRQARASMQGLKMHPREALPNVTALRRAEALHAELRAGARDYLRSALVAFEAALDRQDPGEIEEAREILNHTIAELSHG